jgi:hypothetical protein
MGLGIFSESVILKFLCPVDYDVFILLVADKNRSILLKKTSV